MEAPKRTVARARALRKSMTPPEARLWLALRGQAQGGLRFRRQHPIGPFVLDFYCDKARLAVEVDGEVHGLGDHPQRDERRDDWMEKRGILTLRVPASEVRDNIEGVVEAIVRAARRE
ncbi:MAG: endonuclease domain-containing protein [Pseudomonadota bacterium]|nr:endonuclease domain-containing protein [Pseudomonadota bacterium]